MSLKKQARNAPSTKERELGVESEGLRLKWIIFLDEYIKNGGNGQEAYKKAYPNVSNETARVNASRLLTNTNVKDELKNKLNTQRITEDFIKDRLIFIVENNLSGKEAFVGVKALELLSKIKGMLVDTKRVAFTGENPAVFVPLYNDQDKKELKKQEEKGNRIIE